jgi:hypothetical protein
VEIVVAKLKKYKSPGSDRIPAELIQAGGEILLSAIHKLINSVWNTEELSDKFTKKVIKHCNIYRGITLLSTLYKILSNIFLSRLVPYIDEIIGDHRCGFRRNRSTTDHIFFSFGKSFTDPLNFLTLACV